jgi:hypothetical protein
LNSIRALDVTGKTLTAAAIAVLALAGCGMSHTPSGTVGSGTYSQAVKLANCMRAHGVPNLPDPSAGGGGVDLAGAGVNPQSPAFKAAGQACARASPKGRGVPQATESQFLAALRFAKCTRMHGFSDFPDPTRMDSPAPILVVGPGLFFHVSASFDPNTAAFKQAVAECGK